MSILIFIPFVSSIGVTPSKAEYDFVPNLHETTKFTVFSESEVEVYVTGGLKDYITLNKDKLPIGGGNVIVDISLPAEMSRPGIHKAIIGFRSAGSGGQIGSIAAVQAPVIVRVPYPGPYIESSMEVDNVRVGETVKFLASLINYGDQESGTINLDAVVYDLEYNLVGSTSGSTGSLDPKESRKVALDWYSVDVPEGEYLVNLTVDYDGNLAFAHAPFRIGDVLIKIEKINGTELKKGEINIVTIKAKSYWNEIIEGVYAQLEFEVDGDPVIVKSESRDFDTWKAYDFDLYVDATDLQVGDYKGIAKVIYNDKIAEESVKLSVNKNFLSSLISTQSILIFAITILILINLNNYLKRRNRKKKVK